MNIDQYSIQRVAIENVKTDEVLDAHEPSTDAKKKNAQHNEAKRITTTAPRHRKPVKKAQKKQSLWQKLVG